jgi:hypothetical protein
MRKILSLFLILLICVSLSACGSSDGHSGQAKTPPSSSALKGRKYEDVIVIFEKKGFTNISTERIDDLVIGWLTGDGEVQKVSIDGDFEYSPDKWVANNAAVVVYYHTFPNKTDNDSVELDNNESKSKEKNTSNSMPNGEIKMPNSTSDYIGSEWTIETLTEHLKGLGFTNIHAVPCDPDDDNFRINIREMVIETGRVSTDPWNAGDEFNSNAEISIYYNESPLLTVDNCPDLLNVLTSKDMSYIQFCSKYDGQYVEFDAYVTHHLTYDGGTSHIINVTGGDYDGTTALGTYDYSIYDGLIIRVGDRTWLNSVSKAVSEGDNVTVSGRIDASWAEYFKCLYVETMYMGKR